MVSVLSNTIDATDLYGQGLGHPSTLTGKDVDSFMEAGRWLSALI